MPKYIFTFTLNHPLENYIQPVYAENESLAQARMVERYGHQWGFRYTEEQWAEVELERKKIGLPRLHQLAPIYYRKEAM